MERKEKSRTIYLYLYIILSGIRTFLPLVCVTFVRYMIRFYGIRSCIYEAKGWWFVETLVFLLEGYMK